MRPHEVYMHLGLLDSLPKISVQRRRIMDFIYSLREHPDIRADYTDKDVSLRERQIKIIGDCAITLRDVALADVPYRTSGPPTGSNTFQ